ncbi:hypothetical protein R5M72_18305, partial [Acinetobacter baumannii]|uniref:hypothetical protein n=1 Tax=Acinetobacter baumannii TaxID=470 RepID=UPI002952EA0A
SSDTYGAFPVVVLAINRPNNFLLHFSKNGKDIKQSTTCRKIKNVIKDTFYYIFWGCKKAGRHILSYTYFSIKSGISKFDLNW